MKPEWKLRRFDELTNTELYEIIALRERVFVVEQDCPYADCDGKDPVALHLAAYSEGTLVAYCRIFAPGVKFAEASFGRVIVEASHRGQGLGRELTQRALEAIESKYGPKPSGKIPVRISAQSYLVDFYSSFGFKTRGEEYLEDNKIPHFEMLLAR